MNNRYSLTFRFFDTEHQAEIFCNRENQNSYIRKRHPAHFTPWESSDGKEKKFIAWYATK